MESTAADFYQLAVFLMIHVLLSQQIENVLIKVKKFQEEICCVISTMKFYLLRLVNVKPACFDRIYINYDVNSGVAGNDNIV